MADLTFECTLAHFRSMCATLKPAEFSPPGTSLSCNLYLTWVPTPIWYCDVGKPEQVGDTCHWFAVLVQIHSMTGGVLWESLIHAAALEILEVCLKICLKLSQKIFVHCWGELRWHSCESCLRGCPPLRCKLRWSAMSRFEDSAKQLEWQQSRNM